MTNTDTINTDIDPVTKMANQIGNVGVTDQQIALRLARTLTSKNYTVDFLPGANDPAGILDLLSGLAPAERLEMGDLIARNAGVDTDKGGWPQWLERLLEETEHDSRIIEGRRTLTAALDALHAAFRDVDRARATLAEEFDVELEESSAGELLDLHIQQARIAVRTAITVNPVQER